ncbi:WD repeat-containing protein WRAP73-like [Penaeus chinensis]|uniref:WD repeat-containing protein WRAP73-like n=1 Tax=Penaeus chinensis TaxID=139456 RepID=UPI001FB77B8A|nr:WD repeat-containing protein WRAP73-like [Penaeus chinensis]XP_047495986.1 WD repeat-containing protein WRAP73-like [Penaeus chinensis]XP_047495987.1 WD repeat-containing protein WRAP73-like [Penaeus chinensis]
MNFAEVLRTSGGLLSWSPNGRFCAVPITARLEIRDSSSLQILVTYNCTDAIQVIEWSPDSNYVLTANYKRNIVEVWSIEDPDWRCKVDEGSAGLIKVNWAPDSRHILTTAEFHLRITVWSLVSKSVSYIKNPKNIPGGLQFSQDKEYLAVAERQDCKDYLSVLETKSWQLVKHFELATRDIAGLQWANDSSVLVVWESPLEYKVLIYSLSGQCLANYSAYQWSLGIKSIAWSPSGQFLAIGSYDQKVRLMNHITWRIISEFSHSSTIDSENCVIYKEVEKPLTGYPATLASVQGLPLVLETTYEEEESRPVSLASITVEPGKQANPRIGVGTLLFSSDNRYLATRNDNMPATVWIWSIPKLALKAILVHANPIKDMAWDSQHPRLALCTGNSHVYFWSPFGCLTVAVPGAPTLQITSLRWHPSGLRVALIGRDQFSVCFFDKQLQLCDPLSSPQ